MIILYHGSDYNFNHFEFKNVGKKSGTSGAGFGLYFTTSKADALAYGKYVYTIQFQPKSELLNHKKSLTLPKIEQILKRFEELHLKNPEDINSYIECWGLPITSQNITKISKELYKNNSSDTEIIADIINATDSGIYMMDILVKLGYSHTIDYETPEDKTTLNYCIYDLKGIKIIKKEKPLNESIESVIADCEEIIVDTFFGPECIQNLCESVPEQLQGLSTQMEKFARTKTLSEKQGRAKSKSQRRLMAMALAYKRGKLPAKYASEEIKKLSASIDQTTLHDFAKTNQKRRRKDGSVGKRNNIPEYVEGSKYKKKKK